MSTSIADTAKMCQELLRCCSTILVDEKQRVEIQRDRFNLWAANIGVFGSQHASLDYRLRTALLARASVKGNLEVLCMHLILGAEEASDDDLRKLEQESSSKIYQTGVDLAHRHAPTSDPKMRHCALDSADDTINMLHRLSLAIRTASNRKSLTKVPNLYIIDDAYSLVMEIDESGAVSAEREMPCVRFDATLAFEDFVRRLLNIRWPIPDTDGTLDLQQTAYRQFMFDRCVTLISARRRQLQYFQDHQAKLSGRSVTKFISTTESPQTPTVPGIRPEAASSSLSQPKSKAPDLRIAALLNAVHQEPSDTVPSGLQLSRLELLHSEIATSSALSSNASNAFNTKCPFEVPPPPKLNPHEEEAECPYCCLICPAENFTSQTRWREHLLLDLQPFVCLFQNCEQSGKTYQNFDEWRSHLSKPHVERWKCPLSHVDTREENELIFEKSSEFLDHLALDHPDIDETRAWDIRQTASQPASLPLQCFFCLARFTCDITLEKHLSSHLEEAFLTALPGRDDVQEENAPSDRPSRGSDGEKSLGANEFQDGLPDVRNFYQSHGESTPDEMPTQSTVDFSDRLTAINNNSNTSLHRSAMLSAWTGQATGNDEARDCGLSIWSAFIAVNFAMTLQRRAYFRLHRSYFGTEEDPSPYVHTADIVRWPPSTKSLAFRRLRRAVWVVLVSITFGRRKRLPSLCKADSMGDARSIKALLDQGANVNEKDGKGRIALEKAAYNGHRAVVRLLLDRGADVEASDSHGYTALMKAAMRGSKEVVQLLLDRGADIEASDSYGNTALMKAAMGGRENIARVLLDSGADIEEKTREGETALLLSRNCATTQLLCEKGSNIEHEDNLGETALMKAAYIKNGNDIIEFLIEKGADVNAKNARGTTALMIAAFAENSRAVGILLEKGADVNAQRQGGETALMLVASSGSKSMVNLLLDHGANHCLRNNQDEDARSIALKAGNTEVVSLLMNRG